MTTTPTPEACPPQTPTPTSEKIRSILRTLCIQTELATGLNSCLSARASTAHNDAVWEVQAMEREMESLRAERDAAQALNSSAICVYCGTQCEKTAEGIIAHVMQCEKHPMKAAYAENEKLRDAIEDAQECTQFVADLTPALARWEWAHVNAAADLIASIDDIRAENERLAGRLNVIDAGVKADADDLAKMRDGTKLSRAGLVELLVYQRQDNDELRRQLEEAKPSLRLVAELYKQEPSLKVEGLENFDGYFVHWDEIIKTCANAGVDGYSQSPIELIIRLIDQRNDALARCAELERTIAAMQSDVERSDEMARVLEGTQREAAGLKARCAELETMNEKAARHFSEANRAERALQAQIAALRGALESPPDPDEQGRDEALFAEHYREWYHGERKAALSASPGEALAAVRMAQEALGIAVGLPIARGYPDGPCLDRNDHDECKEASEALTKQFGPPTP